MVEKAVNGREGGGIEGLRFVVSLAGIVVRVAISPSPQSRQPQTRCQTRSRKNYRAKEHGHRNGGCRGICIGEDGSVPSVSLEEVLALVEMVAHNELISTTQGASDNDIFNVVNVKKNESHTSLEVGGRQFVLVAATLKIIA